MSDPTLPGLPASPASAAGAGLDVRIQTICLLTLTTFAGACALWWLRPVLIPFVLALVIAMSLRFAVQGLVHRLHVPRALALPVVLLVGFAVLAVFAALLASSAADLAANADSYSQKLQALSARAVALVPERFHESLSLQPGKLSELPVSMVGGALARSANAMLGLLSQSLLVAIFVLFLVLGQREGQRVTATWAEIEGGVQAYVTTKVLLSIATGLLVGVTLGLLGVPLASVFGLLAFLLNFIPSIGSVVATLLPLPILFATPELSATAAVLAIAIPAAIQFAIGSLIEPKLMGDALALHPITILIGLIFWGMLWGVVGMLLATPILAVMRILLARFDGTQALAELMSGRMPQPATEEVP